MKTSGKIAVIPGPGAPGLLCSQARHFSGIPLPTNVASMVALHLLEQWRKSGRDGVVFLAGDENRAERLASIVHSLDRSSGVLVFPRLNNLPFDGLEPSREIAGRRSSVLRRLAKRKKPVFLVSTVEAIMIADQADFGPKIDSFRIFMLYNFQRIARTPIAMKFSNSKFLL